MSAAAPIMPVRRITADDVGLVIDTIPDEADRLLGLLACASGASIHDVKALSPADLADAVTAAAAIEGVDEDRAEIIHRLDAIYGPQIKAAQAEQSGDSNVDDAPADPEPVVKYMPVVAPVTVRLQYPFKVDDHAIRQITLHPPRFSDVQAVTGGKLERTAMIAEMAGLPVAAINSLRWPDAERVVGIAMDMAPEFVRS